MKRTLLNIIGAYLLSLCYLLLPAVTGYGGESKPKNTDAAATETAPNGGTASRDPNACHLLTHEEVSALVEEKIVMRDQVEAGQTWSTCQWENANSMARFILTVYWSNGKQEWENWHTAQGLGNQRFMQAEDVNVDDVVHQGPVAGLGDAAYFSELLPSLLLKGEVLFEINLNFTPRAETKFAGLARKLLAKVE